jgi:O-antigen ligase
LNGVKVTNTAIAPKISTEGELLGSSRHGGLYTFLLLLLAWAPIPIGSNRGWSLALLEAGVLFLLGVWALSYTRRPFEVPAAVRSAHLPLLFLTLWIAYPLIQLIPVPTGMAEVVGAKLITLYAELPLSTTADSEYLSLDRSATFAGFIRQCSLVALFFCVLALTTSASRLKTMLGLLLLVGFAEALYGLLIYFGGDELGMWSPGQAQVTVSGTYVNQNHFAGLMEMTIPVGMGLLLSVRPDHGKLTGLKEIIRFLSAFVLGQRGVILFCILVMTAALIMTNSRGGAGALLIGVTVAIAIAVMKKGIRARELKVGLLASALVVIAVSWLGSGQFAERLQTTGLASDRGDLRELTYNMIVDAPVVGAGLGTYRWVLPSYKDERFGSYFYEHAHNDYLEVLSEQGFIGFSLLASGVLLILILLMRAFGRRRDPLVRGALFAAIAGSISFMTHGLVDFNFQIPANAGYFFVLLGLGTVASSLRRKPGLRQNFNRQTG